MLRLKFRIRYIGATGWQVMVLLLMVAGLTGRLMVNHVRANEADAASMLSANYGMRQYYVTRTTHLANQAKTACAPGYHFASIWELANTSNLRYNTSLGANGPDSGEGPPTAIRFLNGSLPVVGWVRTGYVNWSSEPAGKANCLGWLSGQDVHWGSVAQLGSVWLNADTNFGIWDVGVRTCDSLLIRVWCVEDDSVMRVYLPIIVR